MRIPLLSRILGRHRRTKSDPILYFRSPPPSPPTGVTRSASLGHIPLDGPGQVHSIHIPLPPVLSPFTISTINIPDTGIDVPATPPPALPLPPTPMTPQHFFTDIGTAQKCLKDLENENAKLKTLERLARLREQKVLASQKPAIEPDQNLVERRLGLCERYFSIMHDLGLEHAYTSFTLTSPSEDLDDSIVNSFLDGASKPNSPWSRIIEQVVGERTSSQYVSAVNSILDARRDMRGTRKETKFWKDAAKRDGANADLITPSSSAISEVTKGLASRAAPVPIPSSPTQDGLRTVTSSGTSSSSMRRTSLPPLASQQFHESMSASHSSERFSLSNYLRLAFGSADTLADSSTSTPRDERVGHGDKTVNTPTSGSGSALSASSASRYSSSSSQGLTVSVSPRFEVNIFGSDSSLDGLSTSSSEEALLRQRLELSFPSTPTPIRTRGTSLLPISEEFEASDDPDATLRERLELTLPSSPSTIPSSRRTSLLPISEESTEYDSTLVASLSPHGSSYSGLAGPDHDGTLDDADMTVVSYGTLSPRSPTTMKKPSMLPMLKGLPRRLPLSPLVKMAKSTSPIAFSSSLMSTPRPGILKSPSPVASPNVNGRSLRQTAPLRIVKKRVAFKNPEVEHITPIRRLSRLFS